MDFSISDDQVQLQDSLRRFAEGEYPQQSRGQEASGSTLLHRWKVMAEMGLLGLSVPLEHGGSGLGATDQLWVMQEIGRCLAPEPYLATAVIASQLIQQLGSPEHKAQWLQAIAGGQVKVALAVDEPHRRNGLEATECRVTATATGVRLKGRKTRVLDGSRADAWLVIASEQAQLGVWLVPASTPGVTVIAGSTLDARDLASVEFDLELPLSARLAVGPHALAAIEASLDRASAALCAEAVGAMDELIAQTVEFLKVRQQFGAPLAKFQALQHRLVDMLIGLEQARSMSAVAAMAVDEAEPARRAGLVSAARVRVNQAGRLIAQEAVQMHGAMGMTDECRVGHYVKRLMVNEQLFGDTHYHLQRFAASPVKAA